ncbi:hypothetical protein JVU11DRAFT_1943 [Chiua virens]|nr:hypothetical protein JVU11DRAFT_1943 [Chiua virens]
MAKLAMSLQKRTSQTLNKDAQGAVDTHKKVKATISDHEGIRQCSSKSNIGKGGQKAQLQNIERIQTQMSDKAPKLATATTNKPMNPMALLALDVGSRVSKESSGGVRPYCTSTNLLRIVGELALWFQQFLQREIRYKSPTAASLEYFLLLLDTVRSFRLSVILVLVVPSAPHPTPIPDPLLAVVPLHPLVVAPSHRPPVVDPQRHRLGELCSWTLLFSRLEELNQQSRYSFDMVPEHSPSYQTDSVEDASFDNHRPHKSSVNIDEISPDEDEQEAEKGLRGPNTRHIPDDRNIDPVLLAEERHHSHSDNHARRIPENHIAEEYSDVGVRDMVNEHHQCNRFPCPPHPTALCSIQLQQQKYKHRHDPNAPLAASSVPSPAFPVASRVLPVPSQTSVVSSRAASEVSSVPSQDASVPSHGPSIPPQVPALDVPAGPLDGNPTKLRAYPVTFRPVIEHAKLITQCDSSSVNPFMSHVEFLDGKATEYFNEALAETANVPQGYWPHYRRDLSTLLWEAMMMWHSTLKNKAREIVPRFYSLGEDHPAAENKAQAQALVRGSTFTFNGVDEEGSTNNMAAPMLSALILSFFYNGSSSLAVAFPDVFAGEVPQVTVCLAVTAAAINKYTSTGTREDRKFEYQGYSKIFAHFYTMQLTINENPKHTAKTRALRIKWANSAG